MRIHVDNNTIYMIAMRILSQWDMEMFLKYGQKMAGENVVMFVCSSKQTQSSPVVFSQNEAELLS
jgi:hypothetical protein